MRPVGRPLDNDHAESATWSQVTVQSLFTYTTNTERDASLQHSIRGCCNVDTNSRP